MFTRHVCTQRRSARPDAQPRNQARGLQVERIQATDPYDSRDFSGTNVCEFRFREPGQLVSRPPTNLRRADKRRQLLPCRYVFPKEMLQNPQQLRPMGQDHQLQCRADAAHLRGDGDWLRHRGQRQPHQ